VQGHVHLCPRNLAKGRGGQGGPFLLPTLKNQWTFFLLEKGTAVPKYLEKHLAPIAYPLDNPRHFYVDPAAEKMMAKRRLVVPPELTKEKAFTEEDVKRVVEKYAGRGFEILSPK
jgi:hypothetical protein